MDRSTRKMLEQLRPPANQTGLVNAPTSISLPDGTGSGPALPNSLWAGLTCVAPLIR
jgi:hypothetical protein